MSAPDACTLFPDRLGAVDWSACCAAHDLAYATGADRLAADYALGQCVLQATGWHGLSFLMFLGVTLGGWLFWKRPKDGQGR